MTVIYEITATVRADLIAAYERYMLERHIPDLLATNHFRSAEMARGTEAAGRYQIRYAAHSQQALDDYLANDAARLRADFTAHFTDGVVVSREIWTVIKCF